MAEERVQEAVWQARTSVLDVKSKNWIQILGNYDWVDSNILYTQVCKRFKVFKLLAPG